MENQFKYEVAFSFLQQDESIAIKLNELLQERVSTFLYLYHQKELAGKDGEAVLNKVFSVESRTVIILFRKEWGTTPWTRIEETAIKNRAFNEGYDFCLLIPIDDKPNIPQWFPKNRIWFDLERLGFEAAIAIAEERIKERGGCVKHETIEEQVARQQRKIAFTENRKYFLESAEAVKKANKEAEMFFELLKQRATHLSTDEIPITPKELELSNQKGIILLSYPYKSIIYWNLHFHNSLNKSQLIVRLQKRNEEIFYNEKFDTMREYTFKFDVNESQQYFWQSEQYDKKAYFTSQLSDFVLKLLIDNVAETKIKMLQSIF